MSSSASNAGPATGSHALVVSSVSTLILAPILHGLVSLVLIAFASFATMLGSLGLGLYPGFALPIIGVHGLKCLYIDLYFVHPILCFVVLPAIAMTAIDHGWTIRASRFASYVGTAIASGVLLRVCGPAAGLYWFAALGGLCSAFVFEATPKVIRRIQVRRNP